MTVLGSNNIAFGAHVGVDFFGGTKSGQEPSTCDCDTIYFDFRKCSKWIDFGRVAGALKNDPCAPWDGKGTTKTPRALAGRSTGSPS